MGSRRHSGRSCETDSSTARAKGAGAREAARAEATAAEVKGAARAEEEREVGSEGAAMEAGSA